MMYAKTLSRRQHTAAGAIASAQGSGPKRVAMSSCRVRWLPCRHWRKALGMSLRADRVLYFTTFLPICGGCVIPLDSLRCDSSAKGHSNADRIIVYAPKRLYKPHASHRAAASHRRY
ncbi:hypothetical protein BDU57DRAFT_522666, partial [Ampelomyces quisqualis]